MMKIRVCFTVLPALLKQTKSLITLNQQHASKFHQLSQKHLFLVPVQSFCTLENRQLSKINDSGNQEASQGRIRVYNGLLTNQIKSVKWFSLTTSVVGIISQPILYQHLSSLQNLPVLIMGCSFIGLYTFVTPLLLHYVTKKYVTMLDYNSEKDTYIASTTNFFGLKKELEFKTDEVTVPDIPGMFTSFHVKGQALFLEARLFEDPGHYARIMGYDKPMDFKLYETSENSSKDVQQKK